MMSWMAVLGLLGVVVLLVLVAAGVYLGIRLARPGLERSSARALLERRLAAGEIDVDEYYEREGALPGRHGRRAT
jgi:uncharacterized membrane protein